jgi:AcrR family transcriptional regulator
MTIKNGNDNPRERIVRATADLLARDGRAGVSTRAISSLAGVQPPTIYRQFGDLEGLLDEVTSLGYARYLENKLALLPTDDPVDDLRRGWDLNLQFALANPALYTLMHAGSRRGARSPAARRAAELLLGLIERIAEAGRLRVSVETAASMIHACGLGVALSLIEDGARAGDIRLSELTREAIIGGITTPRSGANKASDKNNAVQHAVALKALLPRAAADFTPAERALLASWLDRLAGPR